MNNHFYILYQTTNKINGKFYIGVHQTSDINDGYLGSGSLLKAAIVKYGIENFQREILHIFKTKKEAYQKEKELVTGELVKNKKCYNIKEGGRGGFDHIRAANLHFSSKGRKIIHNPLTGDQTKVTLEELEKYLEEGWKLGFRPEAIQKMSNSGKIKIQSKEHRRKNSETKKGTLLMVNQITKKHKFVKKEFIQQMKDEGWVLYVYRKGVKFIHHPLTMEQKSVLAADIDEWINNGWVLGRVPGRRPSVYKKHKTKEATRFIQQDR